MVSNVVVSSDRVSISSTSTQEVVWQVHAVPAPFQGHKVQLAAWSISGKAVERKNFLCKLQPSSWHHGYPS